MPNVRAKRRRNRPLERRVGHDGEERKRLAGERTNLPSTSVAQRRFATDERTSTQRVAHNGDAAMRTNGALATSTRSPRNGRVRQSSSGQRRS